MLDYANSISKYNILHCCGWSGDKNRVEIWKNYKAAAVNWAVYVEDMDLNVGRDFFNTNCVLGGFDNRKNGVLYSGTLDEIKSETIKLINTVGKKGNAFPDMVIGGTRKDTFLPSDIDLSHIKCVADTARNI